MNIYDKMKAEAARLSTKAMALEAEISTLPPEAFKFQQNGNSFKHYHYLNKKWKYLPSSEMDQIVALNKRMILEMMLKDTKNELDAITAYLNKHHESDTAMEYMIKKPHAEELLRPFIQIRDERLWKWAEEDYPSTAGHPESLIHKGPQGKMYRSKSEAQIATSLFKHEIPNRYEWDREINGIVYHIDFTIRHPKTGEYYYWEHFGLMSDEKYNLRNARKLTDYESVGIFPDVNLILTYESRRFPLSISRIDEIVEEWFLG
ncbi:MAG: hypothetical protein IKD64_05015 [Lachnospiraceae bacterium]|nr:hypothetical protein [Lachnospiraceae bacterium]